MVSLEYLSKKLSIEENLDETLPGSLVDYKDEDDVSSKIYLSSSEGVIKKTKKRSLKKTIYEFLSLEVWHNVLNEYSKNNELMFKSPKPLGITSNQADEFSLYMEFISGYKIKSLGNLKRTTPVQLKNQDEPLPLFPACALSLGTLNRIKEEEGLYHSDYDGRHVLFSLIKNTAIGIIDLENSHFSSNEEIIKESDKIWELFSSYTSSPKDKQIIATWYNQGYNNLIFPKDGLQAEKFVDETNKRYDVQFDMKNKAINDVRIF